MSRRNVREALQEETQHKKRLKERERKEASDRELEKMRLTIEKLQLDSEARDEMEANERKKKAQLDLARIIATDLLHKIQELLRQLKEKKALLIHLGNIGDIPQLRAEQDKVAVMLEQLTEAKLQSARNLAAQQAKQERAEQENRDYHAAAGSRDVEETNQRRSKHWQERYKNEPHAADTD